MQEVVKRALRPEEPADARSVEEGRALIARAYRVLNREMDGTRWAIGDAFTLADCAAAPALFYASLIVPFGAAEANLSRYLDRLKSRPSFDRVLREAEPHFSMFPLDPKPRRV
jgi:glutathione S-transferase